jgi:hypothetical protein
MLERRGSAIGGAVCLSLTIAALVATGCESTRPADDTAQCGTCDDSNPCTKGGCDEDTGECTHDPLADGNCSDDDACTKDDTCKDGACAAGAKLKCDDGSACTSDTCDTATGCASVNNTVACDDGDPCTEKDSCVAGACRAGKPRKCDDGDDCTTNSCGTDGACVAKANSESCDDGDSCTIGDTCKAAGCGGGTLIKCDDGNNCTTDSCDPKAGCTATPIGALPCDDGNTCTTVDACKGGKCTGSGQKKCDDGDPCTVKEACVLGKCNAGVATTCDDKDLCTVDSCQAFVGCKHGQSSASTCDDGSACTQNDICLLGQCTGVKLVCNDGNACTNDGCNGATGCTFVPNTSACDDGNKCTVADVCAAGSCNSGAAQGCKLCGNGALDAQSINAPTACDSSKKETVVTSVAALKLWAQTADAPLLIDGLIDLKGGLIDIESPCAVTVGSKGQLTGAKDLLVTGATVTILGDVKVSGKLVIRAKGTLDIGAEANFGDAATSVAFEADKLKTVAPLNFGSVLCVEATTVAWGQVDQFGATTTVTGIGDVQISAIKDLALVAKIKTPKTVSLISQGSLKIGKTSSVEDAASVVITAATSAQFHGKVGATKSLKFHATKSLSWGATAAASTSAGIDFKTLGTMTLAGALEHGGVFLAKSKVLQMEKGALIEGLGGVDMVADGADIAVVNGTITGSTKIAITTQSMTLGGDSLLSANKQIALSASAAIIFKGKVIGNDSVSVKASTVTVSHKDAFSGNKNCAIEANTGAGSVQSGCKTNGP